MKASYRWLADLSGGALPPAEEVARLLTSGGLEVEGSTRYGEACDKALVARVTAKEPHPQRAKLTLVTVDLGGKSQRVVCGAPNVPEVGGLVVLAPLGTHLPAKGVTLEPREIAGVVSEGMLCSEAELGLRISGGEAGILILPDGLAAPGTPLSQAIPESHDVVFEINLTPNRPDGLGHLGLARDLAAVMGRTFTHAPARPRKPSATKIASVVDITVEDGERCPTPSPLGSQYRLEALGVRAISNVVDITNLVMLKYGHPIHAFDLDLVGQNKIIVRRATPGEKLETLDGVERKLDPDDLVIADGDKPVALAGVMGGQGSGIRDTTHRVLIECAYFTTRGIRRSSRRHGMHTESSHRFERGVDPGDVVHVLAETSALLEELAGGVASGDTVLVGPGVPPSATIPLRREKLDALLGIAVPMAEAKLILERLGCREVSGNAPDGGTLAFIPPSHRPDLGIEADLIEEVVRIYGIDRVLPVVPSIRPQTPRIQRDLTARVTRAAIEVGLSQTLTFAFTSDAALDLVGAPKPGFKLMNPLTDDRSTMRTSLLPGLFDALRRARRHGVQKARLFATGARFLAGGEELRRRHRRHTRRRAQQGRADRRVRRQGRRARDRFACHRSRRDRARGR
jgi:phenylalanyl-tRNA synthetase beta chain